MRVCDLRVRIVRDGHEPNEAEEQRPCCVPIEPVHVISSPKDRREQEGYQNSGSFGENRWGDFAGVNPLSFAREAIVAKTWSRAPVSHGNDLLASPSASTIAVPSTFCDTVPDGETSGTRSSNRSPCAKILGHHATLALKHPSRSWGAWIASALSRSASITVKTGAPGRHPSTGINVLLLRATRGRDLRARCPPSRGGRQTS